MLKMPSSLRHAGAAVVVFTALGVVAACGGGSEGSDTKQSTVRVGSTLTLPPFAFVDASGRQTGYEIDVVQEIAKRLNAKVDYVKVDFSQAITGLQAHKFDLVASNVHITCERVEKTKTVGQFAVPFYQTSEVIVTRAENASAYKDFAALKGKKLGVEAAGSVDDKLASANSSAGYKKSVFADNQQLMQALSQGRIDAALQSYGVAAYGVKTSKGLAISATVPNTSSYNGLLFRADDPLVSQFDKEINEMKTDGKLGEIYKKWFGEDPQEGNAASTVMKPVDNSNCAK